MEQFELGPVYGAAHDDVAARQGYVETVPTRGTYVL